MRWLALLLPLVMSACVALPDTYHQVSAPEGKVEGGCRQFGNSAMTPSKLQLARGKATAVVDGSDLSSLIWDDGMVSMEFWVPVGSSAAIDWSQLHATDELTGKAIDFKLSGTDARYDGLTPLQVTEPLGGRFAPDADPRIAKISVAGDRVDYLITLRFTGKVSDQLDLRLPDMTVDGIVYPGLDMRFQHTVGVACILVPTVSLPH